MAHFPNGVVVITTVQDGMDHAMTANSFTSVSLDPPLVLFCVQKDSRFHAAIEQVDTWVVNFLSDRQADVAMWFAERGRPLETQMDVVGHTRSASGVPVLDGTYGHLECRTEVRYDGGDHTIVVGRVEAIVQAEVQPPPLLYVDHRMVPPSAL